MDGLVESVGVSGRNWRFSHHASLPESDESTESRPTIVGHPIQSWLGANER
jgi:hypothetical protein